MGISSAATRRMLYTLILFMSLTIARTSDASSGSAAIVSSPSAFVEAFLNQTVTIIQINDSLVVPQRFWKDTPIPIDRNISIERAPGLSFRPTLDFGYATSKFMHHPLIVTDYVRGMAALCCMVQRIFETYVDLYHR